MYYITLALYCMCFAFIKVGGSCSVYGTFIFLNSWASISGEVWLFVTVMVCRCVYACMRECVKDEKYRERVGGENESRAFHYTW